MVSARILSVMPLAVAATPLQVFLMIGQSNTVGHGYFEKKDDDGKFLNGTLGWLATDPRTAAEFGKLKNGSGWARRTDVFILNDVNQPLPSDHLEAGIGNVAASLGPGWGGDATSIGPELGFGWALGDHLDEQVLLLKVAWGGKSLAADFRPPSSGGTVGPYYTEMAKKVRSSLANLDKLLPGYSGSYELRGFAWHQGWNDGCNNDMSKEYATNLPNLIRDIREEFKDLPGAADALPVSIGASGLGGYGDGSGNLEKYVIPAQLAVADATKFPEFAGNVASAETRPFFREKQYSPGNQVYHWYNNCESYWLLGKAMAQNMLKILKPTPPSPPTPPAPPAPMPSQEGVLLYEKGGYGKAFFTRENLTANGHRDGRLAWDWCHGGTFDNGHPLAGDSTAELQVTGDWAVRTGGPCCLSYSYPDCGISDKITTDDGVVTFSGGYLEIDEDVIVV